MGLNLACIVQCFFHGSTIPSHGAFPRWCQRVIPSSLVAAEPVYPRKPSGSEVGELLEEHESLDNMEYRQLLKDYHEVLADLSSTKLNAETLPGKLDATCDAL